LWHLHVRRRLLLLRWRLLLLLHRLLHRHHRVHRSAHHACTGWHAPSGCGVV
jgi:hypothetical protein